MKLFSLRSLIDDILLILRNNNISESEDLSRSQIALWVLSYRSALLRQKLKEEQATDPDYVEESFQKTVGPLKLSEPIGVDGRDLYLRKTEEAISDVFDKDIKNIIAVYDFDFQPIQHIHEQRRFFHYHRKYTHGELTWFLDEENKINIQGFADQRLTDEIWVKYISCSEEAESEDDVNIPDWMVPTIKEMIFKNELSFMVRMPSDDDNNSTLDGIKPDGPQSKEK